MLSLQYLRRTQDHRHHALDRIVGYIYNTKNLNWTIKAGSDDQLTVFVDSAFGVHDDRKSHTGKVITVGWGGFPIAIKSHKQKIVATSSCEAELVGLHDCLDLVMWCREIMDFMGIPQKTTKVHVDATSTITQAHLGRPARNRSRWAQQRHLPARHLQRRRHLPPRAPSAVPGQRRSSGPRRSTVHRRARH